MYHKPSSKSNIFFRAKFVRLKIEQDVRQDEQRSRGRRKAGPSSRTGRKTDPGSGTDAADSGRPEDGAAARPGGGGDRDHAQECGGCVSPKCYFSMN